MRGECTYNRCKNAAGTDLNFMPGLFWSSLCTVGTFRSRYHAISELIKSIYKKK